MEDRNEVCLSAMKFGVVEERDGEGMDDLIR